MARSRQSTAPVGIQASVDDAGIAEIGRSEEWRAFCDELALRVWYLCEGDVFPLEKTLPEREIHPRGVQPQGVYREHYRAESSHYQDHILAVVWNDRRNAIWVEMGTHPGGGPTYIPGNHVMGRALELVMASTRLV